MYQRGRRSKELLEASVADEEEMSSIMDDSCSSSATLGPSGHHQTNGMSNGTSNGGPNGMSNGVTSRCLLILQRSLAIQLTRGPPPQILGSSPAQKQNDSSLHGGNSNGGGKDHHPADDMWMYDKGYNLFQSFLEANSRCWWNVALVDATRQLRYKGHVAPGILMVGGPPCALEVLRAAWARNVLRPPADHVISCLGDIDDCLISPVVQGQFTPLPEALCWAILELTSQRQAATLDTLRSALKNAFPAMQRPGRDLVYDALAKLMQERKIYHTAQGYFVVTPETRRLRRESSQRRRNERDVVSSREGRAQAGMLMSNDEAMALVHGEMLTLRDGDVTHQAVQTNLADVICGGNPNDKVLFARCRSVPSRLERRHSLRLWGSARRLHRSGSSRSLPRRPDRSDTSSSAEYASTDSAPHSPTKKIGLLSRLFRRSTRRKAGGGAAGGTPLMGTFSAQYPPTEWFNPRVVHLHSVATQTRAASPSMMDGLEQSQASFQVWDDSSSMRSATLPRRHRRQPSADSSSLLANSTPRSSRRHRSPCSTLPRSKCSSLSRCTSRGSVLPPSSAAAAAAAAAASAKTSANSSPSRSGGSSSTTSLRNNGSSNGVGGANGNSGTPSPAKTSNGHLARLQQQQQQQSSRHSSRRPSHDSSTLSSSSPKSASASPQHKTLPKSLSNHSSHSSNKSTTSSRMSSSPLKTTTTTTTTTTTSSNSPLKQILAMSPLQESAQNSITLQVSTNLSPSTQERNLPSVQSSVTLASSASNGTTISGTPGTKIYVHQNSSPMRSVITFENGSPTKATVSQVGVMENGTAKQQPQQQQQPQKAKQEDKPQKLEKELLGEKGFKTDIKAERPSSLYSADKENKPSSKGDLLDHEIVTSKLKLTNNRLNNSQAHLIDTNCKESNDAMNNSRKLSLSLSKDALSYRNLLKNNVSSNPPSPTKSYDGFGGSFNNVYIEKLDGQSNKIKKPQGSEPNLDKTQSRPDLYSYPSLSDMQLQFTSLAAQKILKGCPLNSVDTLVEVNMAAGNDKPNNCDRTVHTDFGLV
ncbi:probable serine/threonine-protein kinase nek3 [Trichogramma pretiosum]|uniref:probable serine/threonine-protein kinase nek3 n=1 Tax=Trichogramma pretiosum TaxID=7493 RepID=UPI0006C95C6A|nr:probable serine/threonine-protein kinase nek3 [Trichogramma pretiosum]